MDKTFEIELVEIDQKHSTHLAVRVSRVGAFVVMRTASNSSSFENFWRLLPSEAVTIGEQLIAAGKAEG